MCFNYSGIALLSLPGKVYTGVLENRVCSLVEPRIQFPHGCCHGQVAKHRKMDEVRQDTKLKYLNTLQGVGLKLLRWKCNLTPKKEKYCEWALSRNTMNIHYFFYVGTMNKNTLLIYRQHSNALMALCEGDFRP